MKICSLVPSATEILYALGLEDSIVGVTDICDYPPEVKSKRAVCRSLFDPAQLTSAQVEARMQAILENGGSPFVLDVGWLREEKPDLIIAQDLCYRCSPDSREVVNICNAYGMASKITTLRPRTLSEIFDSISQIGCLTGREQGAANLNRKLRDRVAAVSKNVAGTDRRPRVFSVEGIDPLVVGGNWLPEMRKLAGGRDDFFAPGCPAQRITWDFIRSAAPEVLVIALCSSPMGRSLREAEWLTTQEGWSELPAVKNSKVYVAEHAYFSRPGPRIITGLEILAQLFHPEVCSEMIPEGAVRTLSIDLARVY